jgi:hypothetical protein
MITILKCRRTVCDPLHTYLLSLVEAKMMCFLISRLLLEATVSRGLCYLHDLCSQLSWIYLLIRQTTVCYFESSRTSVLVLVGAGIIVTRKTLFLELTTTVDQSYIDTIMWLVQWRSTCALVQLYWFHIIIYSIRRNEIYRISLICLLLNPLGATSLLNLCHCDRNQQCSILSLPSYSISFYNYYLWGEKISVTWHMDRNIQLIIFLTLWFCFTGCVNTFFKICYKYKLSTLSALNICNLWIIL